MRHSGVLSLVRQNFRSSIFKMLNRRFERSSRGINASFSWLINQTLFYSIFINTVDIGIDVLKMYSIPVTFDAIPFLLTISITDIFLETCLSAREKRF